MRCWVLVCLLMIAGPAAHADGLRGRGFVFDVHAGAGGLRDEATTSPATSYGLGVGYAFDRAGTLALGFELDGMASWTMGVRRDRGSVCATIAVWFSDHVALRLGGGTRVGPSAIGDSFTAFARVSYAVHHWKQTSLVVGLDVNHDTAAGPQVTGVVGFDFFTHTSTMNLWNPN